MLEDYFSDVKFLALYTLLKDEINHIRVATNLPSYSNEEFKKKFRKRIIKLGHVCDRELMDSRTEAAMVEEIKKIQQGVP